MGGAREAVEAHATRAGRSAGTGSTAATSSAGAGSRKMRGPAVATVVESTPQIAQTASRDAPRSRRSCAGGVELSSRGAIWVVWGTCRCALSAIDRSASSSTNASSRQRRSRARIRGALRVTMAPVPARLRRARSLRQRLRPAPASRPSDRASRRPARSSRRGDASPGTRYREKRFGPTSVAFFARARARVPRKPPSLPCMSSTTRPLGGRIARFRSRTQEV